MALVEIRMPAEDREGTAAAIGKWLKQRGERVREHEPLLEISTDKVTVEIAAPASGVVVEQVRREGDEVKPGELLGRIDTESGGISGQSGGMQRNSGVAAAAERHPEGEEELSPAVRRLLKQHGLQAAGIPKVARGGRITVEDVERYLAGAGTRDAEEFHRENTTEERTGRMVPHTPMRRSIAAHMVRSVQAAPHVTAVFEADLSAVLRDRELRKQAAGAEVPSVTAYLIRAAMAAIREIPEVNSRWHERHLEVFDWVNFGVGTALENGGLVVPVIQEAQAMDLMGISARLRALTEKARTGKLTKNEMEGATFTLSNHGVSGSLLAAPIIIPQGQVAILGTGKLQKRVIVCETGGRELFRVRPMMYVTLTVDHRALDAQQTNAFLTSFVKALETPALA